MAFIKTGLSPEMDVPDLQIHHFAVALAHAKSYLASSAINGKNLFGDLLDQPVNAVTYVASRPCGSAVPCGA